MIALDRIRLALIGAGGMANAVHYPSLAEFPDVEMSALCDLAPDRLESTGEKFGIEARYTDYTSMLDEIKPDAAYVLMPPHQLYDLAVDILSRGVSLFIEKPPGVTSYQTSELARHAEENGCRTMVAFNRRYIPLMTKAKAIAEERGPLIQAVATFYKNMIGSPPYYGGAIDLLTCDIIHAVDALRWLCGEADKVVSAKDARFAHYENSFNALMRFDSGAIGVLLSNFAVGSRVHTFEMHGRGFSAFINPNDRALVYDGSKEPHEISTQDAAGSEDHRMTYGFYQENRHFVDCLREDREPMTNLADATKTMQLVDRIHTSTI